jgi:hypothetical protein
VYVGVSTSSGPGVGLGDISGATTFDELGATTAALNTGTGYQQTGSNLTFLGNGATITQILNTSTGAGALPFNDSSNYLSVLGGGIVKASVSGPTVNEVSFYWGSIDAYNTITFFDSDGHSYSFTGVDVSPKSATGCQGDPACNGLVTFADKTGGSITGFQLTSSANSFEADNFSAVKATFEGGVPEPSTWMMMILGFAGVGFAAYRKKGRALQFRFV